MKNRLEKKKKEVVLSILNSKASNRSKENLTYLQLAAEKTPTRPLNQTTPSNQQVANPQTEFTNHHEIRQEERVVVL